MLMNFFYAFLYEKNICLLYASINGYCFIILDYEIEDEEEFDEEEDKFSQIKYPEASIYDKMSKKSNPN